MTVRYGPPYGPPCVPSDELPLILRTVQMTPEDIEKHKDYFDNYELKPCPFCGRDILIKCQAKLTRPWWDVHWIHEGMEDRRAALQRGEHVDYCVVENVHMMVSGENEDSVRQEAIRLWNRRVKE